MKLLEGKILLEEEGFKVGDQVRRTDVSPFEKGGATITKIEGDKATILGWSSTEPEVVEISKLKLVEDGEDLPDAVPSEPIVVSSEPPVETEEETPKEEEKVLESNAIASILNSLIVDEFEAVEGYNTAISTLTAEDVEKYGDAIVILNDILNEENIHIGQLQEILKTISESASNIEDGEKEAQEVLNNEETPVEDTSESLDEDTSSHLAKELGKKFMPPVDKKSPRYCYEVYWYDNENWEGDPIFKKFWSRKAQQKWFEEHKNDPDKFGMWDLDGYNINECVKVIKKQFNLKGEE